MPRAPLAPELVQLSDSARIWPTLSVMTITREDRMLLRVLIACSALALMQTQALAGSQFLGTIGMYICDGGEDLCSNTLTSSSINLPPGPFTEDLVFDFVNDFPH